MIETIGVYLSRCRLLAVLAAVVLFSAPLWSQTANGRISGTVKDQTGGAIVGAAVVVSDTARGLNRNLTTDDAGAYLAPNLLPGNYTVRATFTGFQAWERANIPLGVGGDLFIDVVLVPGAQTQTVTITEEIPLVNTTSATLGGTLTNEQINDLPVSGRNFVNLMDLRPGVINTLGNDSGGGGATSVNGLRAEQSVEYLIEGLHMMDAYTGQSVLNNFALRGDATGILSTDAIQEFNQQFNNKAEYGYRAGGSTNIGLKSGTNALHGTGFAFFRHNDLDSRNYFNPAAQTETNNEMQQFGATLGGPILRDKLFFFLSYEQQNLNIGSPSSTLLAFTDTALIANYPACTSNGPGGSSTCQANDFSLGASRAVNASNHLLLACLGLRNASLTLSPRSLSLVSLNSDCSPAASYPNSLTGHTWFKAHGSEDFDAVRSNTSLQAHAHFPNTQTDNRQISGVAKIDYQLNAEHSLNGFLFRGRGDNRSGTSNALPIWRTNVVVKPLAVAGTWTWLPNAVWANSFRVGFARSDQLFSPIDEELGLTAGELGLPTGVTTFGPRNFGYPQVFTISGANTIGSRNTEVQGPEDSFEMTNQVSRLAGNHSLRFGGSFMTSFQNGATWADTRGRFTLGTGAGSTNATGVVGFLLGQGPDIPAAIDAAVSGTPNSNSPTFLPLNQPSSGQRAGLQNARLFFGNPESHVRRYTYSAFFQNDWRIHPRLVLNLGMRYDLTTVPYDRDYFLGGFNPELGLIQEGIHRPKIHNGDHNNVAPRIGFAWDIRGNGKTVLRGGGAITYDLVPLRPYVEMGNNPGPAGNPTAWVIGCTSSTNALDTDASIRGIQTVAGGQTSNCGVASGGTYVTCTANNAPSTQCTGAGEVVLTSAAGFSFAPGTLTTPGGTRNVGVVQWSVGDGTIGPSVFWEDPTAIFPGSAINNCSRDIRIADRPSASGQVGRRGGRCPVVSIDPSFRTPYIESWTLSLQHAIFSNLVIDVAYAGNHGVKLTGNTNDNQPVPFQLWDETVTSATANSGTYATNAAGLTYAQACTATPLGLTGSAASNDIGPSTDNCGGSRFSNIVSSGGARQPFSAKFPYLSDLARWYGTDTSNYNGLQVSLTARNFHGLSLTSGYTYSRGNSSDGGTDAYNPGLDYGRVGSDVRQRFTLSPTYVLPSVTGYYGLLDGWRLNSVFRYQTGLPWTVNTFGNGSMGNGRNGRPDFYGDAADFKFDSTTDPPAIFHPGGPDPAVTAGTVASCSQNRPLNTCVGTLNFNRDVPEDTLYTSADLAINTPACTQHATTATHLARLRAYGCWERNGSVIMPSDLFSFGNMPKGRFDGPTYWNLDFSVTKRQRITERISTEFRAEAFNIFNHPNFDQPDTGTGCSASGCDLGIRADATPDVGATNPVLGSGGPRRFQMGVKIIF